MAQKLRLTALQKTMNSKKQWVLLSAGALVFALLSGADCEQLPVASLLQQTKEQVILSQQAKQLSEKSPVHAQETTLPLSENAKIDERAVVVPSGYSAKTKLFIFMNSLFLFVILFILRLTNKKRGGHTNAVTVK